MQTPSDTVEKEVARLLEAFNRICDEVESKSKKHLSKSKSSRSQDDEQNR